MHARVQANVKIQETYIINIGSVDRLLILGPGHIMSCK